MDHEEMYDKLCKPAFEEMRADMKEILRTLRGFNGAPGVIDKVRDHDRVLHWAWKAGLFLVAAVILQFIVWLFKTIPALWTNG